MATLMLVVLGLVCSVHSQASDCVPNEEDQDALTHFIFTYEAFLGLEESEKLAIGFTVFNRVQDSNFPNSTAEVVNWECVKRGIARKYYDKLSKPNLINSWNRSKDGNSEEYQNALQLSSDILCGVLTDPTDGATDFSRLPFPRLFHAPRFLRPLNNGNQIGKLYFFELEPKTRRRRHGRGQGAHGQAVELGQFVSRRQLGTPGSGGDWAEW